MCRPVVACGFGDNIKFLIEDTRDLTVAACQVCK
jgi:hypothetical protein